MAKAELGTKRIDPETGKKFYDLNKDPIVSPYTGNSYPRSFFESGPVRARPATKEVEEEEAEDEVAETAEFISLEEADTEAAGGAEVVDPDADDEDVVIEDDGDVFIEEEEEEGDDVADIIGGVDDEEV
ncbi:TIGR02300 family protein [Kaistia algarum]|uniref:TIGR02300 family protein n=1 Tax=Kaistia algarum TaxID=2083279 RepID=UPI000CE81B84|nr:TIGR02300 family protein [Kaistia algarum]MCX5513703.1 TIGR02300 family protein [Kaistia algarum]PPE79421.1 TIGR02300 family protein [Kaistia algarum]